MFVDENDYRVVYTVRFRDSIYVLHAFQKKSKQGKKTLRHDLLLIQSRYRSAEAHHREYGAGE